MDVDLQPAVRTAGCTGWIAALSSAIVGCASAPTESTPPIAAPMTIKAAGHGHGAATTHTPSALEDAERHRAECDSGSASACHAAALDAYYAPPSEETDARALRDFERGCGFGYAPSCNGLGVLAAEGRGVPRDPARAAAIYRKACAAGSSTGCDHLADALEHGSGVARDPAAAGVARARTACLASRDADASACPVLP